ncbi:MAG: ABC transporter permease [Bryobacteraceae bacterium]|nr:ABC transporter permease [Bryobacteraceae bacterium]
MFDQLLRDVKYAFRMLWRAPAFTFIAVLCLGVGIGASTTIFSVVSAVLLKPLPYRDSARLVRVYTEFPTFPNGGLPKFWVSAPEFRELQEQGRTWDQLEAWVNGGSNLSGGNEPVRVTTSFVTGGMFAMLGAAPALGRAISPADDREGAPLTVLLSNGLWKRSFGGDAGVVGREVYLNGAKATVIGIMPAGFNFPPGVTEPAEAWSPMQITAQQLTRRGGHFASLIAHLRPGITIESARQEVGGLVSQMGQKASNNFHAINPKTHPVTLHGFREEVVGNVRTAMLMLLGAVGFFLLIACANVANLLLARSDARQREIAVRTAVGAHTFHLFRQFLVEGLLLSLMGAVFGIVLASFGLSLIIATNAGMIPRIQEAAIDIPVLIFSLLVTIVTGIVFGLAPAMHLTRSLNDSLRASAGRTFGSIGANRFRGALVSAELSLALILLIGAGLLVQAFWRLQRVDSGITATNVLTMRVSLSDARYNDSGRRNQFWATLSDRLAMLPSVVASTAMSGLPPERDANQNDTSIENFVPRQGGPIQNVAFYNVVGDKYFETMGVRLVEGRFFDARDTLNGTPSVIVNQTMARTFWPGQSALGKRLKPSGARDWLAIQGVVGDVKNFGLDKPVGTEIYLPALQNNAARTVYASVRTTGDSRQIATAMRQVIRDIDPTLPVAGARTMEDVLGAAQSRPRFLAMMLTIFSALALALAAFGIYGVISYSVAQRTNEFGIRMALGAQPSHVLGLVVREGAILAGIGVVAGAIGALILTRSLDGLLFGVSRFDGITFGIMAAVLAVVALFASWLPAQRATAVDPIKALRYE